MLWVINSLASNKRCLHIAFYGWGHVMIKVGLVIWGLILAASAVEATPTKKKTPARRVAVDAGPPTANDLMYANDLAALKYGGARTTDQPGVLAYPSPYGGIGYYAFWEFGQPTCNRISANYYNCAYRRRVIYKAAPDSLWGSLVLVSLQSGTADKTNTFRRLGGKWMSPSIEDGYVSDASSRSSNEEKRQQDKRDYEYKERQRKFDECRARSPFETCYF